MAAERAGMRSRSYLTPLAAHEGPRRDDPNAVAPQELWPASMCC
jgi:hypothetical protein